MVQACEAVQAARLLQHNALGRTRARRRRLVSRAMHHQLRRVAIWPRSSQPPPACGIHVLAQAPHPPLRIGRHRCRPARHQRPGLPCCASSPPRTHRIRAQYMPPQAHVRHIGRRQHQHTATRLQLPQQCLLRIGLQPHPQRSVVLGSGFSTHILQPWRLTGLLLRVLIGIAPGIPEIFVLQLRRSIAWHVAVHPLHPVLRHPLPNLRCQRQSHCQGMRHLRRFAREQWLARPPLLAHTCPGRGAQCLSPRASGQLPRPAPPAFRSALLPGSQTIGSGATRCRFRASPCATRRRRSARAQACSTRRQPLAQARSPQRPLCLRQRHRSCPRRHLAGQRATQCLGQGSLRLRHCRLRTGAPRHAP